MTNDLETLQQHSIAELKDRWQLTFGYPASTYTSRDFLFQNLVYNAQVQQHGGLSRKTQRRLEQLYRSFKKDPDFRPPSSKSALKAGTRLVRKWQGNVHSVTVLTNSFEYLDKEYKSLSAIAQLITGTRWSGPVFFGLKTRSNNAA
jgi:hypothetical protein